MLEERAGEARIPAAPGSREASRDGGAEEFGWRVLRLANLYRGLIALTLLALFSLGGDPRVVGDRMPLLFQWTTVVYLAVSIAAALMLQRRQPSVQVQGVAQFIADILAVALVMAASGGPAGLGSLLFFPIGAGSLVLGLRSSILLAAIATLALLSLQSYLWLLGELGEAGITQSGLLGTILFFTAVGGSYSSSRLRESEALAQRRGLDLANLAQLNQYIIRHMRTGVIVVDAGGHIRLINDTAREFLGLDQRGLGSALEEHAELLARQWRAWCDDATARPASFTSARGDSAIIPHFSATGGQDEGGTLIFLEDTRIAQEQVQQMKLAALGRLTASIAHEIRNPLAAISHAGELLGEAVDPEDEQGRLAQIISEQSTRMNRIIENVLQLSRRDVSRPEELTLGRWVEDFVDEYRTVHGIGDDSLRIAIVGDRYELVARADPSHLHQVMTNLCDNALRYGEVSAQQPCTVRVAQAAEGGLLLDVEDEGPGVPPEIADRIFEPFYTGAARGTGLGLFICRELCEWNRATLVYGPRTGGGSCFRISFPDPSVWVT